MCLMLCDVNEKSGVMDDLNDIFLDLAEIIGDLELKIGTMNVC